ncbi:MAG TPA: GFA family protein [Rhizomicrobium sp.]|nr:GFA family protein [Rhizomicrobium sp.]
MSTAAGTCACGKVRVEIDLPAFWAWHDHSEATRRAQGCAYATYVGVWKSKLRVTKGADHIARYEDKRRRTIRGFCKLCGTPLTYERGHSPKMVNVPRALFKGRTGREPRYHIAVEASPEWAYAQEPLVPLKGYPGVMWNRAKRKPKAEAELDDFLGGMFRGRTEP